MPGSGGPDYPFFHMDWEFGETPDQTILRLYNEERAFRISVGENPTVEDVVLTMCHG